MAQIDKRIKTAKPESAFDKALEEDLLKYTFKLASIINNGLKISDNFATTAQAHITDADGTLASATSRINAILVALENIGILSTS